MGGEDRGGGATVIASMSDEELEEFASRHEHVLDGILDATGRSLLSHAAEFSFI